MNKVTVKIANHEYTIVGEEKREYLLQLAAHVDEKIEATMKANPKLSQVMAAVLTSINISDEYYSQIKKNSEIKNDFSRPLKELDEANSKILELERTIGSKDDKIKDLNQKIEEFELSLKQNNEGSDLLENHLKERDSKLKEAEEIVDDFQNRLYDLQLKIIELEEKLQKKEN